MIERDQSPVGTSHHLHHTNSATFISVHKGPIDLAVHILLYPSSSNRGGDFCEESINTYQRFGHPTVADAHPTSPRGLPRFCRQNNVVSASGSKPIDRELAANKVDRYYCYQLEVRVLQLSH